jgi:ribokinase
MLGRVGDDDFGLSLKTSLAQDGIDIRHVGSAAAATGAALIMVYDSAQNRIALIPSANAFVGADDLQRLQGELATARLLLLQLEVAMQAVADAARHAKCCTVELNPAPAQPLPDALWESVDLLVVNETEAALLSGEAVHDVASAARAAAALRSRGPGRVILAMGEAGVVACDDAGCRHFDALTVKAIYTTAAGDTFIGALCAALARNEAIDARIALGIQAAAVCVTHEGAQASIPRRKDLLALSPVGVSHESDAHLKLALQRPPQD